MWIIPKNYQLSSATALDTVESKEDLTSLESSIESSLMWRSKPSQLRTWSQRWKRESWLRHLFGRTLKPSQHTYFETALTSSLEGIRVNRLARQGNDSGKTTQDTSGRTSVRQSTLYDQAGSSSRTSTDTSAWGFEKSCPTWKERVTAKRGECSARLKLAHLTREKEYSSWATPNTMDFLPQRSEEALIRQATTTRKGRTRPANLREQVNPAAVEVYTKKACAGQPDQDNPNTDGKHRGHLNPAWVEHLMGVPAGWTQIEWTESDSSETE